MRETGTSFAAAMNGTSSNSQLPSLSNQNQTSNRRAQAAANRPSSGRRNIQMQSQQSSSNMGQNLSGDPSPYLADLAQMLHNDVMQ